MCARRCPSFALACTPPKIVLVCLRQALTCGRWKQKQHNDVHTRTTLWLRHISDQQNGTVAGFQLLLSCSIILSHHPAVLLCC